MKLKNGAEYIDSLKKYLPPYTTNACSHPTSAPHVRAATMTYTLANQEK